jgi:hypothetical protein
VVPTPETACTMAHWKQKNWPGLGSSTQSSQRGIPQLAQKCLASRFGWLVHFISFPF